MSFVGLVRNNPEMIEEFLRLDGLSYLLGALQSGVDKLILKSSFLLSSVLTKVDHKGMLVTAVAQIAIKCLSCNKETAVNMGLVDQLAALLATDLQWEAREHVTAALLNLVVDCPKAQKVIYFGIVAITLKKTHPSL